MTDMLTNINNSCQLSPYNNAIIKTHYFYSHYPSRLCSFGYIDQTVLKRINYLDDRMNEQNE